jgi:hypothetical protein
MILLVAVHYYFINYFYRRCVNTAPHNNRQNNYKITTFWDVMPCIFVPIYHISWSHTREECKSKTQSREYQKTQYDFNLANGLL